MHLCYGIRKLTLAIALAAALAAPQIHAATELIQNGGFEAQQFETNTPANWNTFSDGIIGAVTTATGLQSSISGNATVGADAGNFYALLDAAQPSANALTQSFTTASVTSAVLSFRLFVNDQGGTAAIHSSGLDYTTGGSFDANQHVRVDLLSATAGAFDTGAGVVQAMYVLGATGGPNPNPYQSFSFNLTPALANGGTFQLRFANVANMAQMQVGIDNVSLQVVAVPEPETYALMFAGLGLIGAMVRRRRVA